MTWLFTIHPARLRENRESGFTLIELLVVILIIGVLAAIAIPMFLNQRKAAADASLKSDIKAMAMEMESYYVKNKFADDNDRARSGWSVVVRGSDDARFELDLWLTEGAIKPVTTPKGFNPVKVSQSNAIGITTGTHSGKDPGTYCILGFNTGGSYALPETTNFAWGHGLYYDSKMGGMTEQKNLSPDGACARYR